VPVYLAENSGKVPRLRRIGTSTSADSTRVTIDLEDLVQYASARIRNPDRIFFDLHAARLTRNWRGKYSRGRRFALRGARGAKPGRDRACGAERQWREGLHCSLLTNPPQLVIDLYPETRGAAVRAAKARRNATQGSIEEANTDSSAARDEHAGMQAVSTAATRVEPFGPPAPAASGAISGSSSAASSNAANAAALAPRNSTLVPSGSGKSRSKNAKSAGAKPDLIQPANAALPTRDGQSTLTRHLGSRLAAS